MVEECITSCGDSCTDVAIVLVKTMLYVAAIAQWVRASNLIRGRRVRGCVYESHSRQDFSVNNMNVSIESIK